MADENRNDLVLSPLENVFESLVKNYGRVDK